MILRLQWQPKVVTTRLFGFGYLHTQLSALRVVLCRDRGDFDRPELLFFLISECLHILIDSVKPITI